MRIEEIVIDYDKQLLDKVDDSSLSNQVMRIYEVVSSSTNEFSVLAYEQYPPEFMVDMLDDLYDLSGKIKKFTHNSQMPEIVQFLITYFENS